MIYSIGEMANVYIDKVDQLDYISNNIANANTHGYKSMRVFYNSMDASTVTFNPEMVVDYSPGSIHRTDNKLDAAINGEGFFVIQSGAETTYTRQGNFTIDKDGNLMNSDGWLVLGKSGKPIKLPDGTVNINENGAIAVDDVQVDTLKIVNFKNPQFLEKIDGCLFRDTGNAGLTEKDNPIVRQGHIELSNVQVVKEMAEMVGVHRSVEVYQKVIQTISDQDKLATSQIGRI